MPLVQTSQTTTAGTTFMTYTNAASGIHGLVTWQYEGKLCSHQQLAGNLSADSLRIVALISTPDGTDVVLRIKPFTGVGTYSLGSGNTSAVFRRYPPTYHCQLCLHGGRHQRYLYHHTLRSGHAHPGWNVCLRGQCAARHGHGRRYRGDY